MTTADNKKTETPNGASNKIAVITGGAGGMGLATAHILGKDHHLILWYVSQPKLDAAVAELAQKGISCGALVCDITDQAAVAALADVAVAKGQLKAVIHTAGISPQMASPELIMRVNALGTVNIVEAFLRVAGEGFALVSTASMAAHVMPGIIIPTRAYPLALSKPEAFMKKALRMPKLMPKQLYKAGLSYGISKNFVMWLSRHYSGKFGEKGARIVSVSPGSFDTEMGRLEEKSGSAEMLKTAALKRFGKSEEIAEVLAFCASDKAGYLTGVDILCDGGVVAGRNM